MWSNGILMLLKIVVIQKSTCRNQLCNPFFQKNWSPIADQNEW